MRHRNSGRQLSRNASHRHAMLRNMATSLLRHETIRTTVPKAKELRRVVEPLITLAKADSSASAAWRMHGCADDAVVEKLFTELGPRFKARAGGYTRILKMEPRPGDSADMALMQLVELAGATNAAADEGAKAPRRRKRKPPGAISRPRRPPHPSAARRQPPRLLGAPFAGSPSPARAHAAAAAAVSAKALRVMFSACQPWRRHCLRCGRRRRPQLVDHVPIDQRRPLAVGARGGEQRIDEIDPGSTVTTTPGSSISREPQRRVSGGPRPLAALLVAHHPRRRRAPASEQVPDPGGKNTRVTPPSSASSPATLVKPISRITSQNPMRREVHVAKIAAGQDFAAESQLRAVGGFDELGKPPGRGGVGAGDVGGVAAVLRAGIDEKRAQRLRRAALEMLVMQDRRVFVVRDDVLYGISSSR